MLKKILLIALCFLNIGVRAELYTGGVADVTNGLIAHWKLDEMRYNGTSGEVKDSSGNGNNGTAYGKIITNPNKIGRYSYFDGESCIQLPNIAPVSFPFSVSSWFKTTTATTTLISKYHNSASYSYAISLYNGKLCGGFGVQGTHGTEAPIGSIQIDGTYNDDKLHFITMSANGLGETEICIDGVLKASSIFTPPADINYYAHFIGYGSHDIYNIDYITGTFDKFIGSIDDVRIYNRALTADEVSRLYLLGSEQKKETVVYQTDKTPYENLPTNGLVAHWKLDEMSYNGTLGEVKDSSGNGYDGVATAPIISNPSKFTRSAIFNETAALSIPSASDIFGGSAPRTVSFWAKRGIIANDNHGLISFGDGATRQFWFFIGHAQQDDVVVQINTTLNGYVTIDVENSFPQNTWTHFVCLIDQFTLKLYTNSVFCAQTGFSGEIVAGNTSNFIGDIPPYNKFNGSIDDVRIYDRALTPAEVKALYEARPVEESIQAVYVEDKLVSNPLKKDFDKTVFQNVTNGLVAWWKLDEIKYDGTLGEVKDSSGHGNNGTAYGKVITNPGKIGRSGIFDSYSRINATLPSSLPMPVSVSLWVKFDEEIVATQVGSTTLSFDMYRPRISFTVWRGYLAYEIYHRTLGDAIMFDVGGTGDNKWHILTLVLSETNSLCYVDGIEKTPIIEAICPSFLAGTIRLSSLNDDNLQKFKGSIDDVRIYNRALTPEEVQTLYKYRPRE